ncbi:MAG: Hsp20/alpha crystallin family protein [Proteobacteria bacterium]|nr:Hsp20/alpha crystallin family protein [Pseudomonadota bacterium]
MAKNPAKVPVKTEKPEDKPGAKLPAEAPESMFHPLLTLRDEIDRLFEDFSRGRSLFPFARRIFDIEPLRRFPMTFGTAAPAVDLIESETEYRVTAELPGLEEKDIELTLSDDVLTLSGEKKEEREERRTDYYLSERRYGSFRRAFRMPEGVDREKIEARFENGVLTVTLPKTKAAQRKARKIAVKGK